MPLIRAFNTPANERSFSALVDQVIMESGKTEAIRSVASYANLTIKECQALGLFSADLREVEEVATANPHIYVKSRYFRSVRSVRYMSSGVYPKAKLPGRAQESRQYYFYAVDDSYVFRGPIVGETIAMATYLWATPLVYYSHLGQDTNDFPGGPYTDRPAYYDLSELQWMYLNDDGDAYVSTLGDETEELLRRTTAENWLISDWWDLILEGTKAKLFKQGGDERSALSFALYKQSQKTLALTAGFEAEVGALVGDDE
jgi:hypothetical protein